MSDLTEDQRFEYLHIRMVVCDLIELCKENFLYTCSIAIDDLSAAWKDDQLNTILSEIENDMKIVVFIEHLQSQLNVAVMMAGRQSGG